LADARAAEVPHDAAGVDPRAHQGVLRERLVGLVEEEPGMGPAPRSAIERERVADAIEVLGGSRLVVCVDRRAQGVEARKMFANRTLAVPRSSQAAPNASTRGCVRYA